MLKKLCLQQIQNRLPEDIFIYDETNFDFTDDEYVSILSWLKFYNEHYKRYGKETKSYVSLPIISKRLRMDFGLVHIPSNLENEHGKHIIYLSPNGKLLDGTIKKILTVKDTLKTWQL